MATKQKEGAYVLYGNRSSQKIFVSTIVDKKGKVLEKSKVPTTGHLLNITLVY